MDQTGALSRAVEMIGRADRVAALTGAGISVESGVPDFRGAGGLWEKYDPFEYAHIDSFQADPAKVWHMLREMDRIVTRADPNPAHLALAEMERRGKLTAVITQNVDSLHQRAGSQNVIEFHGSHARLTCPECGRGYGREEVDLDADPPRCGCGQALKPDVVFFGEAIPPSALELAVQTALGCDLMLVIGTSAVVAPASMVPALAVRGGAKVVEINLEPTELTGRVADLTLLGRAGEVIPYLVEAVLGP